MVNTDPDEQQRTFGDYEQEQSEDASVNCRVCGIERESETAAKQCCASEQLDRDRAAVVTSPDDAHVGFAVPPHVSDECTELIHRVRDAIAATETSNPLPAAIRALRDTLATGTGEAETSQIFLHLVWLQEIQVLPGYPVEARTGNADLPTIREYCNDRDDLPGHISKASIHDSPLVTDDPLCRFTPLTTTDAFMPGVQSTIPVYEWNTTVHPADSNAAFQTNIGFNDGTAHNAITIEARNQLARHPSIDWVTAPYRIGTGPSRAIAATAVRPLTDMSASDPPIRSSYMFDFAGFSDGPSPKLEVLGIVVDSYETHDLVRLAVSAKTDVARLVVVPTRTVLQEFIADFLRERPVDDAPTPDNAVDYYNKQPSLDAVIKTIKDDMGFDSATAFTTFQKLLDKSRTPTDALGDTLSSGDD